MNKFLVFLIILFITLSIGGIACGIYAAVLNNRTPEEKKANPVNIYTVIGLVMTVSLLVGLIIFGIYYIVTLPPGVDVKPCDQCKKCLLSKDDFDNLRKAENVIADFQTKASYVPDINVTESCSKRSPGIRGASCGNYFRPSGGNGVPGAQDIPMDEINVPYVAPTPVAPKALPPAQNRDINFQPKKRVNFDDMGF